MKEKPTILAFAGSTREGSYNKKLVRLAAAAAREAGAEVEVIDLRDFPLPLFDQDLEREQGLPDNARQLKRLMASHDGFLISSPEYNSSLSGVLKNAIDWVSRRESADEPRLAGFKGKVAALMSASPGALGGLRGLVHLRAILANLGVLVLAEQKAVPRANEAFDDRGDLTDADRRRGIEELSARLVEVTRRLGDEGDRR